MKFKVGDIIQVKSPYYGVAKIVDISTWSTINGEPEITVQYIGPPFSYDYSTRKGFTANNFELLPEDKLLAAQLKVALYE